MEKGSFGLKYLFTVHMNLPFVYFLKKNMFFSTTESRKLKICKLGDSNITRRATLCVHFQPFWDHTETKGSKFLRDFN
jgi:hypothetical protein